MGWHDSQIYKVRLTEDLELDIDYILQWNKPDLEGLPFTFWIAPATLVFKKIKDLTFEFATGLEDAFEIEDIERPTTENENKWTIITQQGDFQFTCDGFDNLSGKTHSLNLGKQFLTANAMAIVLTEQLTKKIQSETEKIF